MRNFYKITLVAAFFTLITGAYTIDAKAAGTTARLETGEHGGCYVRGTYRYSMCGGKVNCEIKIYKNNRDNGSVDRQARSAQECIAYANSILARFRGCEIGGLQGAVIPCNSTTQE